MLEGAASLAPRSPSASGRGRALRAAGVAAAWIVTALPAALGLERCPFATLFHRPCPGCGMTRAVRLLLAGDAGGSLRMNPFAVPVLGVAALLVTSTVLATLATGSPVEFYKTRSGRAALVSAAAVYAGALAFWILRWFGLFGGPVPVG